MSTPLRSTVLLTALVIAWPSFSQRPVPVQRTPGEPPIVTSGPLPPEALTLLDQIASGGWRLFVRKSFSSRLEEQKPATLTYQTAGEERDKYKIDLAVGRYYKGKTFNFCPSVEWHRKGRSERDNNKLSAAATADWPFARRKDIGHLLRGRLVIVRDLDGNETAGGASALYSLFGKKSDDDGPVLRWSGAYKGTYYPYVGFERFDNQRIETAVTDATFGVAAFEVKVYPLNRAAAGVESPLELVASYTYRHPFDDLPRDRYHLVKLEANLYLDLHRHVAIGFEYQNGADPDSDFEVGHVGLLALRLKL